MRQFKFSPLVLAMAVALPSVAMAQETQDQSIEEIVVTGSFRDSLANALNAKRGSANARDVIMAEDIADFPDLNLAESLQRIPGVAITRDAGEGRNVTVRGLGPQFTRVRINGMEGLSTTGGTDSSGGANRNRQFDFNTFASELFNSLTIHKTASAEIDEGSLGATVDLQTTRPFDLQDDFSFVASGQLGYNDAAEDVDPRFAAMISGKNSDETFGWLASVAYSSRNILEEGFSTVRYQNNVAFQGFPAGTPGDFSACPNCSAEEIEAIENGTAFYPRIPRYGKLTHDQERLGLTGSLQFRPTDVTTITVDALYSKFDATRDEEFLQAFSFSRNNAAGNQATVIRDLELDANNTVIYGEFDNVDVSVEHRYDELTTEFQQFSVKVEHEFTDRFRGDALIGTSESSFENPIQATILLFANDVDGYTFDARGSTQEPIIGYGNLSENDLIMQEARQRPNSADNSFDTVAANGSFDINDTVTLNFGLSVKDYTFEVAEARRDRGTLPGAEQLTFAELVEAGLISYTSIQNSGQVPSPDVLGTAELIGLFDDSIFPLVDRPGDIRTVEESNTGAFLQIDWDSEIASMPFRGNFGVRYVETDLTTTGINNTAEVTIEHSYDDVLPALNMSLEPIEDLLFRFSFAETMTRPSLGSVTPGGSVNAINGTVSYGNPYLEPFRADAYDLSVEWYFTEDAVLSLALFRKEIDSFIVTETLEDQTYASTGLPTSLIQPNSPVGADDLWSITQPINGEGGDLDGYEVIWQQPFGDNFGVIANYTYVDSDVNYATSDEEPLINTLAGLSKHTYSLTGYYENDAFSGRISYAVRDDYLTRFPGRNGNDLEGTEGTANIDMSLSYNINDNIKVSLEGINLTNEPQHQFIDSAMRTVTYYKTGRQFYVGAQYKF